MKYAFTKRKILGAMLLVPALALSVVTMEGVSDLSDAKAQQLSRSPNSVDRGPNGDNSDGRNPGRTPRPCPPGTATLAAIDCTPWTPPTHLASSKEDCSCHVTYKTVNGRRIATKDCYVLLPDNTVHYCQNPHLVP